MPCITKNEVTRTIHHEKSLSWQTQWSNDSNKTTTTAMTATQQWQQQHQRGRDNKDNCTQPCIAVTERAPLSHLRIGVQFQPQLSEVRITINVLTLLIDARIGISAVIISKHKHNFSSVTTYNRQCNNSTTYSSRCYWHSINTVLIQYQCGIYPVELNLSTKDNNLTCWLSSIDFIYSEVCTTLRRET